MTDLISSPAALRERAAHCRDLASHAATPDVAQEMLEIAKEYESDAANLERQEHGGAFSRPSGEAGSKQ